MAARVEELLFCAPGTHPVPSQAIAVTVGFDTLVTDPEIVPGAGMALVPSDFKEMGAMFRALGLPLLFIQEGGYDLGGVGPSAAYLFGVRE